MGFNLFGSVFALLAVYLEFGMMYKASLVIKLLV